MPHRLPVPAASISGGPSSVPGGGAHTLPYSGVGGVTECPRFRQGNAPIFYLIDGFVFSQPNRPNTNTPVPSNMILAGSGTAAAAAVN